jgi:chloramphenicol 3-O-phosphotransferase
MWLVFLHGPPASGKLTIARALQAATELPVFHNHQVVDLLTPMFPFGSAPFVALREEMWLAVMREAAAAGTSLVFTFAPEATVRPGFPEAARAVVESAGGRVLFVGLRCDEVVRMRRVEEPVRREHGKLDSAAEYRELRDAGAFDVPSPPIDLELDSAMLSPERAAAAIAARLDLPGGEPR